MVAPGQDGTANGTLYLDDGLSLEQAATSYISFAWDGSTFSMSGSYDYDAGVNISTITVLGANSQPQSVTSNGASLPTTYNSTTKVIDVEANIPLTGDASVSFGQVAAFPGAAPRVATTSMALLSSAAVVAGMMCLLGLW